MRPVIGPIAALLKLALLITSAAGIRLMGGDRPISGRTPHEQLYDCGLNYIPLPRSWTQITLHHLAPSASSNGNQRDSVFLQGLSFNSTSSEWDLSTIDPKLPFTFFIHGFNYNEKTRLNNTWFAGVLDTFVKYSSRAPVESLRTSANVIFIKWFVQTLATDDQFSLVPTYYRTMANYEIIVEQLAGALTQIIDFVEAASGKSWSRGAWLRYFDQFRFYGHSLGAHIISHTLERVHQLMPHVKFGKLVGLDPAQPCFPDERFGISASRAVNSVNRVMIIHSNAGFTGSEAPRSPIEIVLNGGTFQPNCHWWEIGCNHLRSTDILGYTDDRCQMVAYRCNKYEQFKLGACETCERAHSEAPNDFGCILVNLAEQHIDGEEFDLIDDVDEIRQLADEDSDAGEVYNNSRPSNAKAEDLMRSSRPPYHFVNTNPKFGIKSTSHCLQHYQARLLILGGGQIWQHKCPLRRFLSGNSGRFQFRLFFEESLRLAKKQAGSYRLIDPTRPMIDGGLELNAIFSDKLHTGLLTFEGRPELFVGAITDNIDLKGWSECLAKIKKPYDHEFQFVLDMAFMSHVRRSIRRMYSSVLCGQWNPNSHQNHSGLVLNLCKQSELTQVSERIDELLRQNGIHCVRSIH